MAIAYFYHPKISKGETELSEDEARHAVSVRRLFPGDALILVDGRGSVAHAQVVHTSKRPLVCRVRVEDIKVHDAIDAPEMAIAFPKGDRAALMIDMLAQLGIKRVTPLICRFSEGEYSEKMLDKYTKIAIGAMKQSRQAHLLEITAPCAIEDLVVDQFTRVAHPGSNQAGTMMAKRIIIGPEGGLSAEEVAMLIDKGAQTLTVSPNILRIETAAIACATLVGYSDG